MLNTERESCTEFLLDSIKLDRSVQGESESVVEAKEELEKEFFLED